MVTKITINLNLSWIADYLKFHSEYLNRGSEFNLLVYVFFFWSRWRTDRCAQCIWFSFRLHSKSYVYLVVFSLSLKFSFFICRSFFKRWLSITIDQWPQWSQLHKQFCTVIWFIAKQFSPFFQKFIYLLAFYQLNHCLTISWNYVYKKMLTIFKLISDDIATMPWL